MSQDAFDYESAWHFLAGWLNTGAATEDDLREGYLLAVQEGVRAARVRNAA